MNRINMIKATLFHPDYPVILSNLFPPVNYYQEIIEIRLEI